MATEDFTTTDLGLASLLYALGVPYHGLIVQPGTWQKMMRFDAPPSTYLTGWNSGSIEVNAMAFWRASRTLKHELLSMREKS